MAIAKVADRATVNGNAAVTTVDLVLTGLTVGNTLIIRTSADNSGGGGAARAVTVTNQSGTPIDLATDVAFQHNNDPGAANAGVTGNLIIAAITATSGTVRLTYAGSVVQTAVAEEWSGIDNNAFPVAAAELDLSVASTFIPILLASGVPTGDLVYCMSAVEGPASDTYTGDSDTTNGSWVSLTKAGTSNGTADANQTVWGQYKITTGTGNQQWDATHTNARDNVGIAVVLAQAVASTNYTQTIGPDAENLSDDQQPDFQHGRPLTDAEGLTDTSQPDAQMVRPLTDAEGLSDTSQTDAQMTRPVTDALGLADGLTYSLFTLYAQETTDAEGMTDGATQVQAVARSQTDAEGLSDVSQPDAQLARAITDAEGLTDALTHAASYEQTLFSTLGLLDALAGASAFIRNQPEAMGLLDDLASLAALSRSLPETLGLVDDTAVSSVTQMDAGDLLGTTDTLIWMATVVRSQTDAEAVTDETTSSSAYVRALQSLESFADALTSEAYILQAQELSEALSLDDLVVLETLTVSLIEILAATVLGDPSVRLLGDSADPNLTLSVHQVLLDPMQAELLEEA